ncbi:MAG TPA: hypothetical protein VFP40_14730 [Terriglobales bacterium]|nr:hypothetical protein [Terriglobales bacterium]
MPSTRVSKEAGGLAMWASGRGILTTCCLGLCTILAQSQVTTPSKNTTAPVQMPSSSVTSAWPQRVSNWNTMTPQVTAVPKITYENGQLSIWAESCTLQQVLDAIQEKTGTKVEAPFLDTNKITVELGPGDPVEIVAKLLYGIRFNYIILGSNTPIRRADRVIITPRNESGLMASNRPSPRPAIPALQPTEPQPEAAAPDPNATGEAAQEPKKDETDPNAEKADKDNKDEADKDKSADNKEPSADDAKTAESADAKKTDEADAAVAAMADAPAVSAEPSAAERMANLPEGVNPALASLYPSLFGNGSQNSGGSNGSTGNPIVMPNGSNAQRIPQQAYNPVPIQYNSAGQPILPSNIPPGMWNLYPANLLDLIRSSNPPVVGPVTPLIPGSTGNGAGVLWNQGMTPPRH